MPGVIVHAISSVRIGEDVRTRCGKVAVAVDYTIGVGYELLTERGTKLFGSLRRTVSCKKCLNIVKGQKDDTRRPADTAKRTVDARYNIAGQAARAHSRRA